MVEEDGDLLDSVSAVKNAGFLGARRISVLVREARSPRGQ